jgi:predicted metal-dependent hydrolase
MQMIISGIPIDVKKKKIKNIHLYVKPPDGRVVISAPILMSNQSVERFVQANLNWINTQIEKFRAMPKPIQMRYVSGEKISVWGKQYVLEFNENRRKNNFELSGNTAILSMRGESTAKQREAFLREQYRAMLREKINEVLPAWEKRMGLFCASYQTRDMKTRWGTCNINRKRILFNVQLAQKPQICLEYVVVHELAHLRVGNHGKEFKAILDQYLPSWRKIENMLNEQKPVD